jgi:CRP-like cAMP-binding protein
MIDSNFNKADRLIFVESGCIEVYTYQEGNEFIIDNLEQGSIINFRTFLLGDVVNLNMRCATHTVIQVLNYETLQ